MTGPPFGMNTQATDHTLAPAPLSTDRNCVDRARPYLVAFLP
jgi:hypothetical protein